MDRRGRKGLKIVEPPCDSALSSIGTFVVECGGRLDPARGGEVGEQALEAVHRQAVVGIYLMSICCVVRNLSEAGAALDIGSQIGIPQQFTLIVVPKKKIYSCSVVWRKERRIGVAFY